MTLIFLKMLAVTASIGVVLWRMGLLRGRGQIALTLGIGGILGAVAAGALTWSCLVLLSWPPIAFLPELVLGSMAALALFLLPSQPLNRASIQEGDKAQQLRSQVFGVEGLILGGVLVLFSSRLGLLVPDALSPKLFPWDAWLVWAYEAKVWFEQGEFITFAPPTEKFDAVKEVWVGGTSIDYPKVIPAMILWLSSGSEQWLAVPIGLAWLWCAVSIGLLVFGASQRLGLSNAWSAVAAYLWFSLPIVSAHTALYGYADLWMSGILTCLGVLILFRDSSGDKTTRLFWSGSCIALLLLLPLIKLEGIYWVLILGTVMTMVRLLAHFRLLGWLVIMGGSLSSLIAWVMGIDVLAWFTQGRLSISLDNVVAGLVGIGRHAFIYYDWHLLFVSLLIIVLAFPRHRALLSRHPDFVVFCLIGLGIISMVLPFSGSQLWLTQSTLFSRVGLQLSALLIILLVLVIKHELNLVLQQNKTLREMS